MAHQDRGVVIHLRAGGQHLAERLAEEQPARERHDASELELGSQAGVEGHGTALAEAAQHDAVCWDSGVDLGLDQGQEVVCRGADALGVFVLAYRLDATIEHFLKRLSAVSPRVRALTEPLTMSNQPGILKPPC